MLNRQLIFGLATLLLYAGFVAPARADFTPIPLPDASYVANTSLMPAVDPEYTPVSSVTDGINTATFFVSGVASAQTIFDVGSGWLTWSDPPFSETSTPRVLGATPQLEIQLTSSALVFGFEAEPNFFASEFLTADFFGGGVFRGSISQSVSGDGGARLFAGYSSLGIDDIFITSGGDDFGVAQLRYGNVSPVPEPKAVLLLAGIGLLLCWYGSQRLSALRRRESTKIGECV
jgi:hypothetical protein